MRKTNRVLLLRAFNNFSIWTISAHNSMNYAVGRVVNIWFVDYASMGMKSADAVLEKWLSMNWMRRRNHSLTAASLTIHYFSPFVFWYRFKHQM